MEGYPEKEENLRSMKRKLTRIFGVSLTLVMVLSLMVAFAPVATAADYTENDWGEWGLPTLKADTNIGPMAVAPDGTLYAAIHFWNDLDADTSYDADEWFWKVAKSDDNGYTWSDTEWDDIESDSSGWMNGVVSIVVSPNYADDELVYLGISQDEDNDPVVIRLEEAGEGDVIYLKDFPDHGTGDQVDVLWCIDVWTDEDDDNWIAAATDEDVFVLKDLLFEDWRLQELDTWTANIDKGSGAADYTFDESGYGALEVAFAPDFDESNLLWVIFADYEDTDFWIAATVSPGQWGQDIGDGWIDLAASEWLDMDFPDDYDSEDEVIVYAGLSSFGAGAVWLIEGVDAGDGFSNTIDLFDLSGDVGATDPNDIVSIAVSGDYGDEIILAGAMWAPEIYISDDGGLNWDDVTKPPTGAYWTHVYMEADVVWGGEVFDPDEGMAFASTFGPESAISRADDGGEVYNQVGYIDSDIDLILDLGFHPDFPDTPTYLMSTFDWDNMTSSLWLTENGDEEEPDYVRVLCGDPNAAIGNFTGWFGLVTYSWDAEAIYITGTDEYNTSPDQSVIWKSTNDGQTFGSKRSVEDDAFIRDWEITDSKTIYAACWNFGATTGGFYMSTNSGLSWTSEETGTNFNDIAMSPDFDDGEGFILLGGMSGEIMLSDNDGDSFDDAEDEEASGLSDTGIISVAFDADFADDDADGYMYIYAADDQGSNIQEGDVADTDDVNWDELEDNLGDDDPQGAYATGLVVAEDNALYVISAGGGASAGDIEADGTIDIEGDTSGQTDVINLPDTDITVTSGTFEDEESLTVTLADLAATSASAVSGTLYLEGDDSGATGNITVSITGLSGYTALGEDVSLTGYSLWAEVAGAVVAEDTGVFRLLLWESNNLWESQDDTNLIDPFHLWVTPGTNVLWTIDMDGYGGDPEIWVLEDTCSGQVTLDSPSSGYKSDYETQMRVSWDEVRDADEYEVKYYHLDTGDSDVDGGIEDTDVLLKGLSASSEYEWKVRVSPDEPWHSRWSDKWTFHTALGDAPWAPTLYTPGGVWQYSGVEVDLMPAFSWESAKSADSYQFMLADNAEFTSPLVNEKVPESAYQLDFELEYNSNYFWRVMAYKGNDALSRWSDIGAFTSIEKAVAPPTPAPPATVTQPAPAPVIMPTPIPPALLWTIIGIGALLIIAVIVLIVRTRRVV